MGLTAKDVETTMVGALSSFEKRFGNVWGHGLPYEELTENQKQFRSKWEDCRNEILTRGNSIIRKKV